MIPADHSEPGHINGHHDEVNGFSFAAPGYLNHHFLIPPVQKNVFLFKIK